ncbi:hypothetical protein BT69DRAFT_1217496, partial [Atractiella rhizophila]
LGDFTGRFTRYGVIEHGMGRHEWHHCVWKRSIIPMGGTFLSFTCYGAPLAPFLGDPSLGALFHPHVISVATHDSIGLREDGSTHQLVEVISH